MKKIHWNPDVEISFIPLAKNYSFSSRYAMWYSPYEYRHMVKKNMSQSYLEKKPIYINFSFSKPILQPNYYNIRHNYLRKLGFDK